MCYLKVPDIPLQVAARYISEGMFIFLCSAFRNGKVILQTAASYKSSAVPEKNRINKVYLGNNIIATVKSWWYYYIAQLDEPHGNQSEMNIRSYERIADCEWKKIKLYYWLLDEQCSCETARETGPVTSVKSLK